MAKRRSGPRGRGRSAPDCCRICCRRCRRRHKCLLAQAFARPHPGLQIRYSPVRVRVPPPSSAGFSVSRSPFLVVGERIAMEMARSGCRTPSHALQGSMPAVLKGTLATSHSPQGLRASPTGRDGRGGSDACAAQAEHDGPGADAGGGGSLGARRCRSRHLGHWSGERPGHPPKRPARKPRSLQAHS